MSLLSDLEAKAASEAANNGFTEGWLDATIEQARVRAKGNLGANSALDLLEENKEDLTHLGNYGLIVVLTHVAAGDWDKATSFFVKNQANLEELLAISEATNQQALEAHRKALQDQAIAKSAALRVLLNIGTFTAKYVLPILIGMI